MPSAKSPRRASAARRGPPLAPPAQPAPYTSFQTPLGCCAIVWGERGVRRVALPTEDRVTLLEELRAELGDIVKRRPPPDIRVLVGAMKAHLAGEPADFRAAALDMTACPPFARKVYQALRATGAGETVSYGQLARRAGSARAARAVGQALARNPFPLVVPCHRVLTSTGGAGGFTAPGGVATKAALLALEGVELAVPGDPGAGTLFAGARPVPFDAVRARRKLGRADPTLGKLMKRVGRFRLELEPSRSTFMALAEAIVYQQLTGKAAATIFGRLRALLTDRGSFQPEDVAAVSDEQLRAVGLSRAKAAALRDLAQKNIAGDIPSRAELEQLSDEAIVERLVAVRGIGRWTVEMLLIFQLGRPDVLPAADYGLRKGFARTFGGALPTPNELAQHGKRWRPYRTVASWYLWRALELDPPS